MSDPSPKADQSPIYAVPDSPAPLPPTERAKYRKYLLVSGTALVIWLLTLAWLTIEHRNERPISYPQLLTAPIVVEGVIDPHASQPTLKVESVLWPGSSSLAGKPIVIDDLSYWIKQKVPTHVIVPISEVPGTNAYRIWPVPKPIIRKDELPDQSRLLIYLSIQRARIQEVLKRRAS